MTRKPDTRPNTRAPTAVTFTAIGEGWSVRREQLHTVSENRFMLNFRGHLNLVVRQMGGPPQGVIFAAMHGAYDPTTDTFPLHVHGVATGGMIRVIDGLRGLKKYAPAQPWDGRDAANTPIVRSQKPLTNLPYAASYALQRWWPLRETYVDVDGLRKAYGGPRRGITGPALAEYLMFLDGCRLQDLTMIMGMHVTNNGLVVR